MNTPNSISTALQYQRAGRVAEAEQVYKLLLREQPHSIDALNLLGALVYEDKRFDEAQQYFETVLTLQPGAESHNSMGIVLKAQGKYAEAVEHYEQALALKPNQPEVLSNLGNALKETGKLEEAIAAYKQAIDLNLNYAEAYNNLGIAYKEQHQLEEAIVCYQTAIRLKPNYAEAHHNLGNVLRIQNQLDEAISYFQQAIALKPTYAEAYTSLGSTLQQQGKLDDAIAQYKRLIALQPDSADGFNNLALALQQQKQPEAAIEAFQKALALRPHFPGVLNNLGNLLLETDRLDEAIAAYEQAISQRPNYPEAMNNLGNALQQKKDLDQAIAYYRKALELRPNFVEALSNLGAVLKDQHKLEAAVSCLEQAISLNPNLAEIHNNLGNAYQEQKRIDDAIACYRKAAELKPDMAEVHSNLGNMLQYVGEFEAAFKHFEIAIDLQPDFAGVYNNLGIAYRNAGQIQEAFTAYDRALELKPDFVEAHWNKALNFLLIGDFQNGFTGYEWRFKWSRFLEQNAARQYPQPRWDGSELNGKTIFLHAEQGMGDTIQFIRYVPLVKANGGRIIVECHAPLINLFKALPEIDRFIPLGEPFTEFDVHAPLMSLPHILGTTLETIPAEVPYLKVGRRQNAETSLSPSLPVSPLSLIKIGIVWDGNPQNPYNRVRTVPLAELLPLADIPGVTLYSLQKEPKPEDLDLLQSHPEIYDLRSRLNDFTDTAVLLEQLDLIISIDTAVTHLAGALAKPTWLLLPIGSDWRWMCDRADSPWYPTLRLFRQSTYGDWRSVLDQVSNALSETLGIRTQNPKPKTQNPKPKTQKSAERKKKQKGKHLEAERSSSATVSKPAVVVAADSTHAQSPPAKTVLPEALRSVVKLHQAGQGEEARRECTAFLQTHPDSADGWHLLGLMAHYERNLDEAIVHYQNALNADANHLDTYNNLAVAYHEQGKLDDAIPHYQKAIALKPTNADAHNNYANALRERGRLEEAIQHYQQAIAARPDYADAYNNLGLAHYAKNDFASAATAYRQAIERKPNFPQALNHLGNALKELGNSAEAAQYYQQAIALKPDYAKAYNNWGNVFRDEGDLQTALQYYDQATAIEPNFAEAHWNKALTYLLGGDLLHGFEEYEWRRYVNLPSFKSLREFPGTRWDGSPLAGQLIFLHAEQGMGDVIQFVRYVPLVVQQGGRVILECHPPLMNLLREIPGVEQLVPYGGSPPGYHVHAPLLSLPYIFRTTAETVPATVPYIHPPRSHVQLPASSRVKVGIVWSGNSENPYNRTRAVPLKLLLSLAELPDVTIYSLQKDLQPGDVDVLQAHPQIYDLRQLMQDFVDTASLIQQLDLIISVDTAVTHLAGALGIPTWLLLPFAPDWRWMIHREDSPWYPTVKIFRQSRAGDWASVLQQVTAALAARSQELEDGREMIFSSLSAIAASTVQIPAVSDLTQLLTTALQQQQSGDLVMAERSLRSILQQHPDQPDALHILSVMLCQTKRFEDAIALMQQLVDLQPEFVEGWRNLGSALQEQKQFEAAIASYQRALELAPNDADVHQNLSSVLIEVDRPAAAVTHAERLVALKPDFADGHYNLGYALRRAGRVQEAIVHYRRAIDLKPDMALAHKNLGHALLLTGDFLNGFQEIEWRWQQPGWTRRPFSQPEWDGSDLTGKTILLYAEQGIGDTIQFIRYVPLVKAKGGQIVVECQADLIPLLVAQRSDIDRLIPQDSPLPEFDVHASLMSLPRIFQTTIATIPTTIPYLQSQKPEISSAPSPPPLPPLPFFPSPPLNVGIVWAGNPNHRNDRFRSCTFEQFRPLLSVANVKFFSLQKGEAVAQLPLDAELPVENWSDRLHNFLDTATAIAELDLVITIDTAVAHLAGAMGKPVWVLLMFAADWRWMLDRDDTPWYPTMRLFRQTSPGDWAGVIDQVQQALEKQVALLVPPSSLFFSWQLDDTSDRGILGTQLALHLLQRQKCQPVLPRSLTKNSHINPMQRSRLQALPVASSSHSSRGLIVLDDCNWTEMSVDYTNWVGLMACENLQLDEALIQHLKQLKAIVAGSSWSAGMLQKQSLNPVQLRLQGIDPDICYPGVKTGIWGDRWVIFAQSGYMKGEDILFAAFKTFQAHHANAVLLLSGTEFDRRWQTEFTGDQVIQIEPIAYPLLGQVLREVDVAVFPSRCEVGLSSTIAASLGCGVPTVLSNNTANRDLIQQNLGIPLNVQHPVRQKSTHPDMVWGESDVEELVERLDYLYHHPQEAKNQGAIAADWLRDWTWQRVAGDILTLFNSFP